MPLIGWVRLMSSLFRKFVNANVYISEKFENLFPFNADGKILLEKLFQTVQPDQSIADVGGGKKPAKFLEAIEVTPVSAIYDGYDISKEELLIAKDLYTDIYEIDLTKDSDNFPRKYDFVICLNTLEHVTDARISIRTLSKMLEDGGVLYLKLPCRYAMFAKLNLMLPNELKRKVMHTVFPHKIGDGFKAYYDRSTPHQIIEICEANGLQLQEKSLIKWTSYFSFFFPLYVVWRMITVVQNAVISDYCEAFELTLVKISPA